jgi:polysaccharide biosynthesis/export protein
MLGRLIPLLLLFSAAAPALGQSPATTAGGQETSLQPGDLIHLTVYREPDLNGDFLVEEDGSTVLPLIGRQTVAGIPVVQLRDRLVQEYGRHLRNPSISVVTMRRIQVLGDVQKPGIYPVDPTYTLAGVVALAGGATPLGDLNHVRLIRNGVTYAAGVASSQTLANVQMRSGDQVFVGRRSWFDRNSTFLVSAMLSVTSIVIALVK